MNPSVASCLHKLADTVDDGLWQWIDKIGRAMQFMFTNLFFDFGLVGEFERDFSRSSYDLEILRIAIRNRNFRNSVTRHYSEVEDIAFSDKVEVLIVCVEDQFRSSDITALFSLAMSLLSVSISALREVGADLLISELILLAGIILILLVCSKAFAYQNRSKLLQALRILRSESCCEMH